MADNVNLTIKISPELKEQIKALAVENQTSMSHEITQRVEASLNAAPLPAIDSQDPADEVNGGLTAAELKQIRSLLKKQKKKK